MATVGKLVFIFDDFQIRYINRVRISCLENWLKCSVSKKNFVLSCFLERNTHKNDRVLFRVWVCTSKVEKTFIVHCFFLMCRNASRASQKQHSRFYQEWSSKYTYIHMYVSFYKSQLKNWLHIPPTDYPGFRLCGVVNFPSTPNNRESTVVWKFAVDIMRRYAVERKFVNAYSTIFPALIEISSHCKIIDSRC
jgi:hypothetical protein